MVHFFDADIAKKYGVNAAVLACFLWDCTEQKSAESPQLHEGKVWVRCSVQMMTGFFPFLSYDEIRYALKRLVKGRVLTKGRFNESHFVDIYDGDIENIPEEYRISSPAVPVCSAAPRQTEQPER